MKRLLPLTFSCFVSSPSTFHRYFLTQPTDCRATCTIHVVIVIWHTRLPYSKITESELSEPAQSLYPHYWWLFTRNLTVSVFYKFQSSPLFFPAWYKRQNAMAFIFPWLIGYLRVTYKVWMLINEFSHDWFLPRRTIQVKNPCSFSYHSIHQGKPKYRLYPFFFKRNENIQIYSTVYCVSWYAPKNIWMLF